MESITRVAGHSRKGGVLGSLTEREEIMAKKKNSRKALAVALGIMGIAGLSVASASSLDLTAGNEVAIGVDTFAPCDLDGVDVNYSYAANAATTSGYGITTVTVSSISTDCNGKDIKLVLDTAGDSTVDPVVLPAEIFSVDGNVAAGAFTYDASTAAIDIATDLGKVTVIIG